MKKDFDMAKDCMICEKRIGFRGFCSQKCHDEYYDGFDVLAEAQTSPLVTSNEGS